LDINGLAVNDQAAEAVLVQVCSADKSGGIDIYAGFRQVNGTISMELEFSNIASQVPVSTLAIQLNKNAFGLSPVNQQIACNPPVTPGNSSRQAVELVVTPNMLAPTPAGQPASPQVQVAIKNMATNGVFYFAANFNFEALFTPDGALDRSTFIEAWKSIDDRKELYGTVSDLPPASTDIDMVQSKFKMSNVFFIARRPVPNAEGQEVVYFSMRTVTGMDFLAELTFKAGVNACKICLKTESASYGLLAKTALESLLRA
jgi:AP-1 complex subunit beta-1